MSNPIRLSGLILFIFVTLILSSIYLIFADNFLKSVITHTGTEVVGGKVDLEKAEINLDEFQVNLQGLDVTNPSAPMSNYFSAGNLSFNLDAEALAWRKTIIDEIIIEELFLNTPRDESGAVDRQFLNFEKNDVLKAIPGLDELSNIELPDPETLVSEDNLETIKAVNDLNRYISEQQALLKDQLENLPGETEINNHKEQLNQIKSKEKTSNKLLGFLNKGNEAKKLQKAINSDIDKIKTFRKTLTETTNELKTKVTQLKQLPKADYNRITGQYGLTGNGLENLVSTIFGPQISDMFNVGFSWYQQIAPYLDQISPSIDNPEVAVKASTRNAGRDILFKDEHDLPDSLVKLIKISSGKTINEGINIAGEIKNLTTEPAKWNEPLAFNLMGKSDYFQSMHINGLFDHRQQNNSNDMIDFKLQQLDLKSLSELINNKGIDIQSGHLNISSKGQIKNNQLDLTLNLKFNKAKFTINESTESELMSQIIKGLDNLERFTVDINLSGDMNNPNIAIAAPDLKDLAAAVAKQAVSGKLDDFNQQIQHQISELTANKIGDINSRITDFSSFNQQADSKQNGFEEILKNLL